MSYSPQIEADLDALRERFSEISDLAQAGNLLAWDMQTYMPGGAIEGRGRQSATLEALTHERLTDPAVGEWLGRLDGAQLAADDAALVRLCRRRYDQETKLPKRLVEEFATVRSRAQQAWLEARERSDYSVFAPLLERALELAREQAQHLGFDDHPYDALHDLYEPGSTTAKVREVFAGLREPLVRLVEAIVAAGGGDPQRAVYGDFDPALQERFVRDEVGRFGFDFNRGRLDLTVHPFAQEVGRDDVRLTTRYSREYLPTGVFSTFHEAGHGLYEQGLRAEWARLPLGESVSLAVHESQSRLWENLVGRSLPYWTGAYPRLQRLFPEALGAVSLEEFYRAVNDVRPSLIRVEADEVTYNLHVMIRFELEIALLEGSLSVADLPEAWNDAYDRLLGVRPADDVVGCLQDVHWSHGSFGYFPTYTLGNVMSLQFLGAMRRDLPDLDDRIAAGEFGAILGWLRENIHLQGSRYLPEELLERTTGSRLDPAPYLDYLQRKFGELYGISTVSSA